MRGMLNSDCRIDRSFFSLKQKVNMHKEHHLEWRDDSRLSLRRMEGVRKRKSPMDIDKKTVCDEIVRIAEMEVGPL